MSSKPYDYGLPYNTWRPNQQEIIDKAVTSSSKIVVINAPTGSGKSGVAVGAMNVIGGRGAVLTSTKALEAQYIAEHKLANVHGRANYFCHSYLDCATGGIYGCDDPCAYMSDLTKCLSSGVKFTTNYSYYLRKQRANNGLSTLDSLVADEAHDLPNILTDLMKVELSNDELDKFDADSFESINEWAAWAGRVAVSIVEELEDTEDPERKFLLERDLERFSTLSGADKYWAVDRVDDAIIFQPASPLRYTGWLTNTTDKLILMSASVVPLTMDLLGIRDYEYLTMPSSFPKENAPVYAVGDVVCHYEMTDEDRKEQLSYIDNIIRTRLHKKGIIHAVSYDRAMWLKRHSKYGQYMLVHRPGGQQIQWAVERFKKRDAPCILVSPAVTTGYDFPGKQCEYQILMKIPYQNHTVRENLHRLRDKYSRDWKWYDVTLNLEQMCGRHIRRHDDVGETFIVDASIRNFLARNSRMFSTRWLECYKDCGLVIPGGK